jgi:hypothetical protein
MNQHKDFLNRLHQIPPDEFRAKVEAAERKIQIRKVRNRFIKQVLIGLVGGAAIGGGMSALTYLMTHGGI